MSATEELSKCFSLRTSKNLKEKEDEILQQNETLRGLDGFVKAEWGE